MIDNVRNREAATNSGCLDRDRFALRVQPVYDPLTSARFVPCSSLRTTATNA